jgi:hypothetical protein
MKWKWVFLVLVVVLLIGCVPDNSELWDPGRTYAKGDFCQTEGSNSGSWGEPISCYWNYESLQDGNKGHNPDWDCEYTGRGVWWKCLGTSSE